MEGETRWVCKGVRGVEVKGENLNEERQGEEIGILISRLHFIEQKLFPMVGGVTREV